MHVLSQHEDSKYVGIFWVIYLPVQNNMTQYVSWWIKEEILKYKKLEHNVINNNILYNLFSNNNLF